MRGQRILDGKIVKAELVLNQPKDVLVRLKESDPDEPVVAAERLAHVAEREIGNAPSLGVCRAVDDAGRCPGVFVIVEHRAGALSHRPGVL